MSEVNLDSLAEKIARRLGEEFGEPDLSALQSSIEKINDRLDVVENNLRSLNPETRIRYVGSQHPSEEKFDVIEAVSDEVIEHFETEKACTFEPNGKPCDHCSMCRSRGF